MADVMRSVEIDGIRQAFLSASSKSYSLASIRKRTSSVPPQQIGTFMEPFGSVGSTISMVESTIGAVSFAPSPRSATTCFHALDLVACLQEEVAGPVGFEPTAPGLPRSVAGLEGRCFGHPCFRSAGAVQAELRARYAHTGLLPISAFFYAPS